MIQNNTHHPSRTLDLKTSKDFLDHLVDPKTGERFCKNPGNQPQKSGKPTPKIQEANPKNPGSQPQKSGKPTQKPPISSWKVPKMAVSPKLWVSWCNFEIFGVVFSMICPWFPWWLGERTKSCISSSSFFHGSFAGINYKNSYSKRYNDCQKMVIPP